MYQQTTRSILVRVEPTYLDDQSSPDEAHFVWKYHVRIENQGAQTVQLRNRFGDSREALAFEKGRFDE